MGPRANGAQETSPGQRPGSLSIEIGRPVGAPGSMRWVATQRPGRGPAAHSGRRAWLPGITQGVALGYFAAAPSAPHWR